MPRKVYYGSYQNQRNKSKRKRVIIITLIIIAVAAFVTAIGVVSFNKSGYGVAMQSSVEEMTQMRIRIKELEDEVINLQNEIERYKTELAQRPAETAEPIQPPNDAVATMHNTAEPTSTPAPKTKTKKKPKLPTQPPTQPPVQPTAPPVTAPAPVSEPQSEPAAQPPAVEAPAG